MKAENNSTTPMITKKKLILLYSGVFIFSLTVILTALWIRHQLNQKEIADFVAVEAPQAEQFFKIQGDLTATNQDGQTVKLSDLNNKVWVITEFFANCPLCAERNNQDLRRLYEKHRHDENFHLVCVTVDPEKDHVKRLQGYAEALGADSKNWWFLTGKQEELQNFLHGHMKFSKVIERTDPDEIAAKGRYAHDFGIAVIKPGFIYVTKRDLRSSREMGDSFYQANWKLLNEQIEQGKKEAIQKRK